MAPVLNDIHPSAAQRLLSLVSMLSKKFIRIQKKEIVSIFTCQIGTNFQVRRGA